MPGPLPLSRVLTMCVASGPHNSQDERMRKLRCTEVKQCGQALKSKKLSCDLNPEPSGTLPWVTLLSRKKVCNETN